MYSNKLVYIGTTPYWKTPEGRFEPVECREGRMIDRVFLRTPQGLRPMENGCSPV
ncbi:MAG TPA: hypothetical protein PK393_06600 [Synergistaceae bacterium]|nr:MAG: hypothetical protein BWY88_00196 [Synergistetes bacterium ADurb.Bin520]HOU31831.1 hypothetical protein [Synergistaceae bacterium]HQF91432.1 hypothetical protein [Synergistaceae bacterium]HQH77758.1 hypothetical protein [Synergistaceae bacterium]HQK25175.1 hypothetical protein [Synergistaceae bacterium]